MIRSLNLNKWQNTKIVGNWLTVAS